MEWLRLPSFLIILYAVNFRYARFAVVYLLFIRANRNCPQGASLTYTHQKILRIQNKLNYWAAEGGEKKMDFGRLIPFDILQKIGIEPPRPAKFFRISVA